MASTPCLMYIIIIDNNNNDVDNDYDKKTIKQ